MSACACMAQPDRLSLMCLCGSRRQPVVIVVGVPYQYESRDVCARVQLSARNLTALRIKGGH
jgi:hypothetical protein